MYIYILYVFTGMHISMNYNDLILTSLEGWIVRESATQIELFSSNFQDGDQQQLFYFSQTCLTFDQPCCFLCLECAVQSFFATATNLTCQWVTSHTKKCRLRSAVDFKIWPLELSVQVATCFEQQRNIGRRYPLFDRRNNCISRTSLSLKGIQGQGQPWTVSQVS